MDINLIYGNRRNVIGVKLNVKVNDVLIIK